MTLIELCDDIAKLEAMSEVELLEYCKPYFTVTRPELAPRASSAKSVPVDPVLQHKAAKLAAMGIDVGYLLKRRRK